MIQDFYIYRVFFVGISLQTMATFVPLPFFPGLTQTVEIEKNYGMLYF